MALLVQNIWVNRALSFHLQLLQSKLLFLCLNSFQADFGRIYVRPCEIPASPQNNIASSQNINGIFN